MIVLVPILICIAIIIIILVIFCSKNENDHENDDNCEVNSLDVERKNNSSILRVEEPEEIPFVLLTDKEISKREVKTNNISMTPNKSFSNITSDNKVIRNISLKKEKLEKVKDMSFVVLTDEEISKSKREEKSHNSYVKHVSLYKTITPINNEVKSNNVLVPLKTASVEKVEGHFIVVLKDNENVDSIVKKYGLHPEHTYKSLLNGFSCEMSKSKLHKLRQDPNIKYIKKDGIMKIQGFNAKTVAYSQTIPWGISRIGGKESSTVVGDGKGSIYDNVVQFNKVDVYILDTGISSNHFEELNVVESKSFVPSELTGNDLQGHGTHVAGIIGAKDNTIGVVGGAPNVALHAIKVLDRNGSGMLSWIIKGVDYVTGQKLKNPTVPMVANLSLGGYVGTTNYNALDTAILNSIKAGVIYTIASGNSGDDAYNYSPAHVIEAITVGAYDDKNNYANFSNYGKVDILAPGVNIYSTYKSKTYASLSGTSMAAPHVAGAAALYLSRNGNVSPGGVLTALKTASNDSRNLKISNVPTGTTNISVYEGTF